MLQVSFYSYKGGAGRSTTSWNTIQRLVGLMKPSVKEPFVIVDTDAESAGSTFLYKARSIFYKNEKKASIQKRMNSESSMKVSEDDRKEFFNGMHPIGTKSFGLPKEEDNAVLFIGADLDKSARWDIKSDEQIIKNFNKIRRDCKQCGAKALFFDTPSGTQDLARLSIQQSDIIVCCMRPTYQFLEGTIGQLISFIEGDQEKDGKRKYILTPTVICVDSGQEFFSGGQKRYYPQQAKDDIKTVFDTEGEAMTGKSDSFKQTFKDSVILDMLEPTPKDDIKVFGIPEIKRFKWFETCLGLLSEDELSDNDRMAVRRYEYLAQTILKYKKEQP